MSAKQMTSTGSTYGVGGMRVLFVTANSFLRSTTSSLNAIMRQLVPDGLVPVMLFREPGPWQQTLAESGVPCYFDPLLVPGKDAPVRSLLDIWKLVRLVKRERIDLIHCNEHEHYPLVRQVARWAGVPAVVTLHWNLDDFGGWAFRKPYEPAAIQFLSRAQLEVSRPFFPPDMDPSRAKLLMSGLAIDDFLALGTEDDAQRLRRGWTTDPSTVVLGTASAIRPRKHLDDFVRLIGRLRRRGLNVQGVLAGGGRFADADYLEMLKQLAIDEQLGDRFLFIGNVDPVTPFFRAIDISINTAEMEILSMSLCEGQSCRKPTLAYAVGGNPETLPNAWCAIPFGNLDEMEAKAATLVTDASARATLGEEACQHVRTNFDAPVLARRQAEIYREIRDARASRAV